MRKYKESIERILQSKVGHPAPFSKQELSEIERLRFDNMDLNFDSFFTDFKSLHLLSLENCDVSGLSSSGLFELARFRLVKINHSRGNGLETILQGPRLTIVNLSFCPIEDLKPLFRPESQVREGDFRGCPLNEESYRALQGRKNFRISNEEDWLLTCRLNKAGFEFSFDTRTLHRPYNHAWKQSRPKDHLRIYYLKRAWIEELLEVEAVSWTEESFWDAVGERYQEEEEKKREYERLTPPPFDHEKHTFRLPIDEALEHIRKSSLKERAKSSLLGLIQRLSPMEVEHVDDAFLDEVEAKIKKPLPLWFRELMLVFSDTVPTGAIFYPKYEPEEVRKEELILVLDLNRIISYHIWDMANYDCLFVASLSGFYILACDLSTPHDHNIYMFYNEYLRDWWGVSDIKFNDIYDFFDAIEGPTPKKR